MITICGAIFKYKSIVMSSDSDSDFEGFSALEDAESDIDVEHLSDISVSDVSDSGSTSAGSSGNASDTDDSDNEVETWSANTRRVVTAAFLEPTGICHNLPDNARLTDYFHLLWPEALWRTIADETNRYADQRIAASGQPDPRWSPTNPNEIRAFVAVNMMMGIKRLPAIWCYWSTNPQFWCSWISGTMPQTRYLKLSQYLHIRDNTGMPARGRPNFDPVYKLRQLLDILPANFRRAYRPGREVSIDEAMVGFKGRLSFRQYMPAKPTKWGVKVWELCESKSGYCLNLQVYTGRVAQQQPPQFGLGHRVVMDMMSPYLDRRHHLYFDRFFASPKLAEDLADRGTYSCSTVMLNRRGLPDGARKIKLKDVGAVQFQQKGNELLTVWKDKRQVCVLSTNSNAEMVRVGNPPKQKPQSIVNYNMHMGGVDLADQLRSYYKVGRPCKKWWRYIFWFLLDVTLVNAWVIFQASTHNPPMRRNYDQLAFRVELAELLRAGFTSRKHVKGRRSATLIAAVDPDNVEGHHPVRIQSKRGRAVCRQCSQAGRKTHAGYQIETCYKCSVCDIALCKVRCFAECHP